jgi:hypothetical protein
MDMRIEEIEKLLANNSDEKLNNLLNLLCAKADKLDADNRRVGLFMLLLIAIFTMLDSKDLGSISLDIVNVSDFSVIKKFAPLTMALLIFKLALNSAHQVTLNRVIQKYSSFYFKHNEPTTDKERFIDSLTRLIVPLNFSYELTKFLNKERLGFFTALVTALIGLFVVFGPLYFNIIWLYELVKNDWCTTGSKLITFATIILLLITFWFFIKTIKSGVYIISTASSQEDSSRKSSE